MAEHCDNNMTLRAVRGDADALEALLAQHGPEVESNLHIAPLWRSVLEPQDVMQVTYLEAFLQIDRFDPLRTEPFAGWLQRIAQNNLRDAIRGLERQKRPHPKDRVQPRNREETITHLLSELGATRSTPSLKLRREEADRILRAAIDALPQDYATVIQLHDFEGQAVDQVAAVMKRSAGAIHMLRARAQDQLRQLLGSASCFF